MLPFVPSGLKCVLDVGCGAGGFGALLKERFGCEAWGIESNEEAAAIAATKLDHVLVGDASVIVAELPKSQFDLIACNDVLEHMPWPDQFLANVTPALTESGVILASLPNLRYFRALKTLLRGDFPWEPDGIFDRTHLRFFTFRAVRELFERAGYSVDLLQGINPASGWKLSAAIALSLGRMSDIRYLQIAVRARPKTQ